MTTTTTTPEQPQVPPLTRQERALLGGAIVLGAGVGTLGLISSFDTVSAAAKQWRFGTPELLPIAIDVAIPVFTVVHLLMVRMDMAMAWVRFVPWVLTLVTCWLNVAAGKDLASKVAHGTMPLLWVVLSEVAAHIYAVRIGAVTGRRMEKVRFSRWLLAPRSTFGLWRRMTLWEITSYSEALTREKKRQLARAALREQHGRLWRFKAPRRERVLLRMGDLAPATDPAPPPPADETKPPAGGGGPKPRPGRRKGAAGKGASTPPRSFEDLLTAARKATAEWKPAELTADSIRPAVGCSQDNARKLRDTLKAERGGEPPLQALGDAA